MRPYFRILVDVKVLKINDGKKVSVILSWEKIDICKLANDVNAFPMIRDVVFKVNKQLKLLHPCPYENLDVTNITFSISNYRQPSMPLVPNGNLKLMILVYNNREKNLLTLQYLWTRHIVFQ